MQLFWVTFCTAKIARRHATANSLLNQMPLIDWLVNYAWYPGTVQVHNPPCASDAFLDVTVRLYEHGCVNFRIFVATIHEN